MIRFINCQADRLTYEFLKNGKANLSGITMLPDYPSSAGTEHQTAFAVDSAGKAINK